MDSIFVLIAFVLGFASRQVGLPPLVGYLVAGFLLNAMNFAGGAMIVELKDVGVTLLLFTIGLKLRLGSLAKPEVWAGTILHMLITVIVFGAGTYLLAVVNLPLFNTLDFKLALLIAFALSFSSTVFAVKVLEEKAEMSALHGRVAIGILVMQDILAVVFLTASSGKLPSPWALIVPVILFAIRLPLFKIMDRCGHGELLILFGLLLSMVIGANGFESVGLKPDLGALILGILVAGHPKANELAKSLFSFKEVFLVGFFLSIGLGGLPGLAELGIAALLVLVMPLKVALFFLLMTRFKLRARTSLLGSLSLANYSEFGLIVAAIGVTNGWIGNEWLIIIAIALSATFVLASPLNSAGHSIYARLAERLKPFETEKRRPDDQPIDPGDAELAVFGMGRVGTGAYDFMHERFGDVVIGVDYDPPTVTEHKEAGRKVVLGDPTDLDFWARTSGKSREQIKLVLLTMPHHAANLAAAKQIAELSGDTFIAATAQFDDEIEELKDAGAQAVYNFYSEAGTGLAEHIIEKLEALEAAASRGEKYDER
jgi:predicted Kef-type K+ transport protein